MLEEKQLNQAGGQLNQARGERILELNFEV